MLVFAGPEPGSPKFQVSEESEVVSAKHPGKVKLSVGGEVKDAVMQPIPLLAVPIVVVNWGAGGINQLVT